MKRTKRLTHRQIKKAKKVLLELASQTERPAHKPAKATSILSLTVYLQKQSEKKHAKMHEREERRAAKADKVAVRKAAKEAKKIIREAKEAKKKARESNIDLLSEKAGTQ